MNAYIYNKLYVRDRKHRPTLMDSTAPTLGGVVKAVLLPHLQRSKLHGREIFHNEILI